MAVLVTNVCTELYKGVERVEIARVCMMFQRMIVAPSISITLLSMSGPDEGILRDEVQWTCA